MICRHGTALEVCREICARCGHACFVHRAELGGRGVGGVACYECDCRAWVEPTGVAVLDQGVELIVDDRHAEDGRWSINVRSWGNDAGHIHLVRGRVSDEVMVEHAVLRRDFRGKGIAHEVYTEIARLVRPAVLTSGVVRSPDADALWERQVKAGYAVRSKEMGGYFRLEKPPAREPAWKGTPSAAREEVEPPPPGLSTAEVLELDRLRMVERAWFALSPEARDAALEAVAEELPVEPVEEPAEPKPLAP